LFPCPSDGPQVLFQLAGIALPVPLARIFSYRYDPEGAGGVRLRRGDLVVVPFGRRRRVTGLVTEVADLDPGVSKVDGAVLRDVIDVLPSEYRITGDRLGLARWLSDYYVDVTLTPAQENAVARASGYLDRREFGTFLLHGVTGSGKTEVYLTVIARALEQGRGAIFLLPEIALTPQTLARIEARFGGQAAAIHSGLSAGQRCAVHEGAARGDIRVVVGPRSALFAPLKDVGVIVVDEEHETSYKQDEKPRYHARHAALVRGRETGAVVILGSATPDLESLRNTREGRSILVELPERLGGELPEVEVVDLRGTDSREGFTAALTDAVAATLEQGRQVILYYNRRGFARVLQCRDCGEVVMCPNCDIGLTYHLRPRRLLCHYCAFTRPVPDACPDCSGEEFLPSGGGTEKVELHLQARFPEARILRLDHDTTRRRGSHRRILSAFARREADILIGTQMVAKGHHFPGVDLVGVLAADDGLGLPDFRASERSFQLLTQVAGRSGREGGGRVVFQAWQPEHPVIQAAAAHDYAAFIAEELPLREALGYPPFRRLVRLGIVGKRLGLTEEAAARLADALRGALDRPALTVLGPAPAVFPRLQDRYRFQILIKGSLRKKEKEWLAVCLRSLKEGYRGIDVVHDVDPVSMY